MRNLALFHYSAAKLARGRGSRQPLAPLIASWFSSEVVISRAYLTWGLTVLLSQNASAQAEPAQPAAELSPSAADEDASIHEDEGIPPSTSYPEPLLITRPDVEWPSERSTLAEVVVELVIDDQGKVTAASVVVGPEPFATATVHAAPGWQFSPALRDGKAVAAKIHFIVTFTPPPALPAGPDVEDPLEPKPQQPAAPAADFRGEVLEEVVIMGDVPAPGATVITRDEAKNLAGTLGDPLRALESMPGVIPTVSGLPLFFVRGAPPGNIGYFIDGIRVPLLYHAFLGPSVLHPATIKEVSLSAGPMPAEYGRYAGAALEAKLNPVEDRRAEGAVRIYDIGAFGQTRFAKERGYVQLSGRYSYTGLLFTLVSPNSRADYWDYQGRIGYALGNRDELSVMALGAYDYFGTDGDVRGGTEFHRIDARWDHNFSPKDHLRTAVTWGKDRTRTRQGDVRDQLWGMRLNFEHSAQHFKLRAGLDTWIDKYSLDLAPSIPEPEIYLTLFPARTDVTGGAFIDLVLEPTPDLRVIPGIRVDQFTSLGETRVSVDPRLAAEYQLTNRLKAIHAVGIAHQSPNFIPGIPAAQVGGLDGGLQASLQADVKYEYSFPFQVTASVAGFINGTQDMTDPIGLTQTISIDETSAQTRALGRTYGFELYVKRPLTKRLGGFISYTFSKTLRSLGDISTRSGYDRPHVLNAAVSYEFDWDVRLSLKFAIASGVPTRKTTPGGFVFDEDRSRSRPFVRLDAKLEKRFHPSKHIDWGLNVEALNATYSPNISSRTLEEDGYAQGGTAPIIIPSLGADISWQ